MSETDQETESTVASDCSEIRDAVNRLRQVRDGGGDVYDYRDQPMIEIPDDYLGDLMIIRGAFLDSYKDDDGEPITGEWLLAIGCEYAPCHVHDTPDTNYRFDGNVEFWQFNDTPEWMTVEPEIPLFTRGDVRQIIRVLARN